MPYTLSHPAAVLALGRTRLPMAAMVFGSVVPDFPMFGLTPWSYDFAHSWTGVLTADVAAGAVLTLLWVLLVRDAMAAAAPSRLRERLQPATRYTARDWLLVGPSTAIGAVTHVAWDELTHGDRWGAHHLAYVATIYSMPVLVFGLVVASLAWRVVTSRPLSRDRTRCPRCPA